MENVIWCRTNGGAETWGLGQKAVLIRPVLKWEIVTELWYVRTWEVAKRRMRTVLNNWVEQNEAISNSFSGLFQSLSNLREFKSTQFTERKFWKAGSWYRTRNCRLTAAVLRTSCHPQIIFDWTRLEGFHNEASGFYLVAIIVHSRCSSQDCRLNWGITKPLGERQAWKSYWI